MRKKKDLLSKLLQTILLTTFIMSVPFMAKGQDESLKVFERWVEWTDGSHMLVHHLNRQAFECLDQRDEEIAGLKTKEHWIKRQTKVRDILMNKIAGPFPEKTPLNAKVTGVVKKDDYRIEKIVFESQPAFFVTGALFIPEGRGRKPAILFTSGHTQDAFRYPSYQTMILNLVKKGFIVFAIDPVSQGERVQLNDDQNKASFIGPTTREHSYLGSQTIISGVSLARYFIWDGIRAIDYLLTRKEVDPDRLGVSGQSGGGTQAAYIFACDDRIKAGAPVNYITGFRRLLGSIGPQDAEQNMYHIVKNGITHADFLELRAPSPALIVAGTRDFFSIQGARETYDEVKKAYGAFDAEDNIGIVEDDFAHGYTPRLREGIYAFFQKSLDLPGNPEDEEVTILDPQELQITPTGQVATSYPDAATVISLNIKETQKLIGNIHESRKSVNQHLTKVRIAAAGLSGYVEPSAGINPVFRGRYQRNGYAVEMYALRGEGDYVIPVLLFVPSSGNRFPGIIYVHPKGKEADAALGGQIELLVKKGYVVAAPDVIGTGETAGTGAGVAMLIGRSTAGLQAGDIGRVVNFLKTRNYIDAGRIGGIAFERMGPVMLHAASLNSSVNSLILAESPVSYRSIVMSNFYYPGFAENAVAGALTAYDLPDLIGTIAPRKIALVDLRNQMNERAEQLLDEELAFPKAVYVQKEASANIRIMPATDDMASVAEWCFR